MIADKIKDYTVMNGVSSEYIEQHTVTKMAEVRSILTSPYLIFVYIIVVRIWFSIFPSSEDNGCWSETTNIGILCKIMVCLVEEFNTYCICFLALVNRSEKSAFPSSKI